MKENNKKKSTCHRVTPRSVKIIRLCLVFSSANCIIPNFFQEIFPIMIEEKEKTNLLMNFVGGDLLFILFLRWSEERKEFRSPEYAVACCAGHFLVSLFSASINSWRVWILYVVEVLILLYVALSKPKIKFPKR